MLKIIDTYEDILVLRNSIIKDKNIDLNDWKNYLSAHPTLMKKCIKDSSSYNFNKDIKPVILEALTNNFPKLDQVHKNFMSLTDNVNNKFKSTFHIKDDIYVYFYVGLCNGAGWATKINSDYAVLLGVEKIVELGWYDKSRLISLLYHELCHIAHNILREKTFSPSLKTEREKSIWQLYIEGFAQRYQQVLYKEGFYHQDKNGWLRWCQNHHDQLKKDYLEKIKNNLSTQDFYGDWVEHKGYSDVGYYLGCEFIKHISDDLNTKQIANLNLDKIESFVINYLEISG
ncbi:hypothetical protein DFR79_1561 [Halanaerobium saccharolyticum]|uniref:DUF2268 domain-containing protein n=1 Tax=Halanaerobium saccharolyticum TaxID=43595 RepID=A0A4R6LBV6_9FIRM|nr:hypothetical protein [Halanaerobium saccharolyticum]TDO70039.1 hypothetical protein DFR79_1561 [Halanaerobium saccharolyticum]